VRQCNTWCLAISHRPSAISQLERCKLEWLQNIGS